MSLVDIGACVALAVFVHYLTQWNSRSAYEAGKARGNLEGYQEGVEMGRKLGAAGARIEASGTRAEGYDEGYERGYNLGRLVGKVEQATGVRGPDAPHAAAKEEDKPS